MNDFPLVFGTPWPWWLLAAGGGGACYLTWRGYRRRQGEVQGKRLKLLKALRFTGWGLLLLCLLQPLWRQHTQEKKTSRLTCLIDDSESMSFNDTRNGPPRLQLVKEALLGAETRGPAPDPKALKAVLGANFTLQWEGFGPSTRTLTNLGELQAQGESTDIAKALTESFARLRGPDAAGLVLISDGADTGHGDLERVCALYKHAGTPIYALGVGEPDFQDLSIDQVRCRRTVSKDTLVHVDVDVRRLGYVPGKHKVFITHNGKIAGTPIDTELKDEITTVAFEFLPDGQGFLEYEACVEPFPGELLTANNTLTFGLMAYSRKLRVLYIEGSMYVHRMYSSNSLNMTSTHPMQSWWEHEFCERALSEDPDVEVDTLSRDPFSIPQNARAVTLKSVKEGGFPATKKELYQYDVIFCSKVPYGYFTADQVQWIVDFVGKHGGGFVMIGGYFSFAEGKYPKTPIDRMLPVEMLDEDHDEGHDFNWRLTDEAWTHPIMQLEKDPEKNKAAWARLPAFHGFSKTTRAKPAATTLAVIADDSFDTAYGPALLLAVQPFGNGRSMAFTTDTTGSWGTEWEDCWGPPGTEYSDEPNLYFKTFWKNSIRWLAHYRMQAPNQLVQLETDQLVYGRGETAHLRVKVLNPDYEPTHDAQVRLSVAGPDGRTEQFTVFPSYQEPGIYERALPLSVPGRYEIEAVATLAKEELGRDRTLLQVRAATAEMRAPGQNLALLKRLAEQTGGKYLPLARAAELPQYLRDDHHLVDRYTDHDLWDRPAIFVLIITLLCGEWFLRKRSGLP